MLRSIARGYRHAKQASGAPHLSSPIEVPPGNIASLPAGLPPDAANPHQIWDGFDPPCTLDHQDQCKFFPSQTSNIKVQSIYSEIGIAGDDWMRMACDEATGSVRQKGGPFGAVILQIDDSSGQILRYWKNHNQVTSTNDPTAHAEVMTIRSACASLGVFDLGAIRKDQSRLPQPGELSHCIVYSSAEPCPMCYAAICWANLRTLLFAATRFDAAVQGVDFSDEAIYEELSKPYSERALMVRQCTTGNSLDAFNLWKRSEKTPY